jgi:hypothetical protein
MKKEIQIVKKSILVVAILFAGALVAQACPNANAEGHKCNKADFTVVNVEDINSDVQVAILEECQKQSVVALKEILQNKETGCLKVVAINADNEETVLFFDKDGKLKENKE